MLDSQAFCTLQVVRAAQGQVPLEQHLGRSSPGAAGSGSAVMSPRPRPQPAPRAVSASGRTSCPRLLETQNEDLCPGAHPAPVVPPPIPLARVGWGPLQRRPGSEFPGVPLLKGSPLHPARPSLGQTVSFGEDACSLKRHQGFAPLGLKGWMWVFW